MRKRILRYVFAACCLFAGSAHCQAGVVTFGSGANQFNMEFVTIGNPGNAPDTDPNARPRSATLGSVGYTYGIGKFEVSRDMITKFNASQSLQITLADMTSYGGNGANKPATGITWKAAARFVNWLNISTGGTAVYKFTTEGLNGVIAPWHASDSLDYDPLNPHRSKRAKYVLPSSNEWYKAAYYSPSGTYYDYPNGSNTRPTAVTNGTATNTAVYTQLGEASPIGPADVDRAGGLSPYGVMGLGGNIKEWHENTSAGIYSNHRFQRGGDWDDGHLYLSSNTSESFYQILSSNNNGFRVVSLSTPGGGGDGGGGGGTGGEVPEPTSMAIFALGSLGIALRSRFRK